MRRWLGFAALALLALALVACSGDDDDDDGGDDADSTATATATSSDGDGGDDADGSSDDGDSDGDDGDNADGDGAEAFGELLQRFGDAEFRVQYQMTAESADGETFSGLVTWYRSSDGRVRFDFESDPDSAEEFSMISIVTEEGSYLCTGLLGGNSCFEFGAGGGIGIPDPSAPILAEVERLEDLQGLGDTSRREINGVDATCVEIDEEGSVGEACFSDGGVMLLVDVESPDGNTRMEFLDLSEDVSDEDFEPPYPIQSFPG